MAGTLAFSSTADICSNYCGFVTGVNKCTLQIVIVFFRLHTFTNTIKHSRVACYLTCLVRRNRRFVVRLIEFAPTKKTATPREACCFCCDCTYVSPLPNSALAVCTLFYLCFFSFYPKGVSLELLLDLPVALCTE